MSIVYTPAAVRSAIRNTYGMQKMRIQAGNRVSAMVRQKLGLEPNEAEEENPEVKGILDQIRSEYSRITDGLIEKMTPSRIRGLKYEEDGHITNISELILVDQYVSLLQKEEGLFKMIGVMLEDIPIYREFLSKIPGIGIQMAAVLIGEIDITRCKYPSSLIRLAGLDTVTIGVYKDKEGKEQYIRGDVIKSLIPAEELNLRDTSKVYSFEIGGEKLDFTLRSVGRSARKYCLEKRPYTDSEGEECLKDSLTYRPWLKTKLIGVLAGSFLKQSKTYVDGSECGAAKRALLAKSLGFKQNSKSELSLSRQVDAYLTLKGHDITVVHGQYAAVYYEYRTRLEQMPAHAKKTPAHRHNMALRYMIKIFLQDYYAEERRLAGLEVYPTYAEAKLGLTHGRDSSVAA